MPGQGERISGVLVRRRGAEQRRGVRGVGAQRPALSGRAHRGAQLAAGLWLTLAILFVTLSLAALSGDPRWSRLLSLPAGLRNLLDRVLGPTVFLVGGAACLAGLYRARGFFTRPAVAWGGLNGALLLFGLSLADPDFVAIVAKPDNVPIVGLVFLLGFFTWLAGAKRW